MIYMSVHTIPINKREWRENVYFKHSRQNNFKISILAQVVRSDHLPSGQIELSIYDSLFYFLIFNHFSF